MIFLTVGCELPFNRLVRAVDQWAKRNNINDIIGQIGDPGPDGYWPTTIRWQKFIPGEEYIYYIEQADLLIGHAGMGSIITAAQKKKPIIIFPRKQALREHRNDHQIATAKRLSTRKGIAVAYEEEALYGLLDTWVADKDTIDIESVGEFAEESLISAIREFILAS